MAQPVLFDDGGSTRIKQLKGTPTGATGKMDGLIEVVTVAGTAQSTDVAQGPFTKISITCLDESGNPTPCLDAGGGTVPAGTFPIPMALNHSFQIFSGKHRVQGKIVNNSGITGGSAADCQITVLGTAGIDPIVEARHSKQQRRYIISNAPAIDRVDVNVAGPARTFTIPTTAVYTTVVLML